MGDLSPHFSRWEFDSRDGARATPHPTLIAALERLRAIVGRPLAIVSGYRSPAHNKRVGGAPKSQHLVNRAADIPSGYATVEQAARAGFTGIGSAGPWAIHVDVRTTGRARWRY
jgi:uncharacterized protein YcbK (DUF882 family)